jgi:hypothetical protein
MEDTEQKYMTTPEAAKELGISRIAVYLRWRRGKLPAYLTPTVSMAPEGGRKRRTRRLLIPVEAVMALKGKVRCKREALCSGPQ